MSNVPLMNRARKTIPFLIATLAPFCGAAAHAAGLGELTTHSSLGEPLRAEVRLMRAPGEDIDANCVKAVSGSSDDMPWIHNARIRLAGDRLLVTTREPVNHPIAMLGLRVACGFELRREFTLLLSPPVVGRTAPLIDTPVTMPDRAPADAPTAPATSRRTTLPPAAAPHSPRPPATTSARPAPASARPAAPARQAGLTPPAAIAPLRAAAARAPEPPRQDRLVIGAGDEASLVPLRMSAQLANPPKSDDSGAPPAPRSQEQRTLAEIDDRIAAQLELDEKIKRLEEYQALLKERVVQLDQNRKPAAAPASAQATPPAGPQQAETDGMQTLLEQWTAPVAGLLAVLLGGGALIYLRRRRSSTDAPALSEPEFHTTLQHPGHAAPVGPEPVIAPAPAAASIEAVSSLPEMRASAAPRSQPSVQADSSAEWSEPTFAPAHPIPFDETVDEHDSALELAEIMMSFGRTQGAAETLADYIRNNPRQAVKPWLKLLEVYHVAGMRAEFEALTRQLNKTFNVKMISWSDFKTIHGGADTVEQMPHVIQRLQDLWGTQEAQAYIHQILRDNRNGTRQGFPLTVVEELLLLLAILDDELGTYKPPTELSLVDMEPHPGAEGRDSAAA